MLEDGVASAEDIDRAMELGYRHPMGPLRLTDLVGLDVRLDIARHLAASYGARSNRRCFWWTRSRWGTPGRNRVAASATGAAPTGSIDAGTLLRFTTRAQVIRRCRSTPWASMNPVSIAVRSLILTRW
jgi:hypothetical protein